MDILCLAVGVRGVGWIERRHYAIPKGRGRTPAYFEAMGCVRACATAAHAYDGMTTMCCLAIPINRNLLPGAPEDRTKRIR